MNYKYRNGQKVLVQMTGKNWDDDYVAPCVISQPESYVINAIPVYIVEQRTGELLGGVIETRIEPDNV